MFLKAKQLEEKSKSLKKKYFWKNVKMMLILALLVLIILAILIAVIAVKVHEKNQNAQSMNPHTRQAPNKA